MDEQIRRGQEAARVLDEPLLKAAFADVERGLVSAMRMAKVSDRDTHHELVLSLQILGRIKGAIEYHVQTGKLAEAEKEKQTLAQRVKDRLRRVR